MVGLVNVLCQFFIAVIFHTITFVSFSTLLISMCSDCFLLMLQQFFFTSDTLIIYLWFPEGNILPPTMSSFARIWSVLGHLYLFNFSVSFSVSKELVSGCKDSAVRISGFVAHLAPCEFNSWNRSSSIYSKLSENPQAEQHSISCHDNFRLLNILMRLYKPVRVLDLFV
jgi:hypothetical protein